jgi:hypothetical protein
MNREAGGIVQGLAIAGAVLFLALLVGCIAIANDDESSFAIQQVANHEYCEDNGDCYSQDYDQNYGSRDDCNRNRNRERGAFSPGPFDDSPVDAFNNLCMPGATCYYQPPEERQPT